MLWTDVIEMTESGELYMHSYMYMFHFDHETFLFKQLPTQL